MSAGNDKNDDLHLLSTLLLKERPEEESAAVKTILASGMTLPEKIRQIEELDHKIEQSAAKIENQTKHKDAVESPPSAKDGHEDMSLKSDAESENDKDKKDKESSGYLSRPKRKPVQSQHDLEYVIDTISSDAASEVRTNRLKISHNRKMLKPLIKRSSFLRYFFTERRRIRNFAAETGILQLKFFGTKIILNQLVIDVFPDNIRAVVEALLKSLKPVLEHGWHYLEKRDYNLVVLLYKLCLEIKAIDFSKFDPKSAYLIDRMPAAELLFLILHYEPGDVKELRYAVDSVYGKDPSKLEVQKEVSVNIHKLLDKDQMKPSLYNLIVGLNIIKSKTYLELQDLRKSSLKLIDSHDYECSAKIRDKIDEYLRKLEKGMQPYLEQEKEVFRLQAFIPTDGKGAVDYSIVKHFYDRTLKSKRLSFDSNKENIIRFIINLGYSFLINFREILTEEIEVNEDRKIRLFAQSIFDQDLARIEFNMGKLDKIQTILPKFPTSRFLSIKKTMTGAIESEAEAIQIVDEISTTMVFMGKRIAHILRNALPADHGNENAIEFFSFDEMAYALPSEGEQISSNGYLKGFSVKQSLYEIAGVCYQAGAMVQHSEVSEILAKEKKIHDEIRIRAKQYKRIAHEQVYSAFLEKYDLPIH